MIQEIQHFVNGQNKPSHSGQQPVDNPATGDVIAQVHLADADFVDEAIKIAKQAQKEWRNTGLGKRSQVFFRLAHILRSENDSLAEIISEENGKTIPDAHGEIARGLENVEFCAGLGHHLKGEAAQQVATGIDVEQLKQPLGVVACITPFNFPAMVPLWMTTAAIAAGNSVIVKPSEQVPASVMWLADAFQRAGLPNGVFNVINGKKDTVEALINHPDIKAVSFVGSTPVAKSIYSQASAKGKRVQALGGAKNHMVVMPDADLDAAADAAVSAGFGAAGQRCMAVSVIVAVGEIAETVTAKIAERAKKLRVGPGNKDGVDLGPVINNEAKSRILNYIDSAEKQGGTIVLDGRKCSLPEQGYFVGPTLVDNVTPGMDVYDNEIFGPVLSVVRVENFDEAVALINSSSYANGVAIFTRDGKTAREFRMEIEVGMVGINVPIPVPVGTFSFGGWKDSLFGDTHIYGAEAFHFYTRRKVVSTRWPDPDESQISLGFPTH
ncbi:CoA-acylating methylmalonate-semialdehyde dehydrogenase [Corynebacterium poyangense]|uniref:methylmalonate-semialdehyde dehydrogenase (CoA acylating) n=1 Tax=Corynebacterium poyangense TaxID=2684405 RepID=A0A7H0SQ50_9CORY|nr:CoA-acylating methylmalonate-semialdehyde dehydrogenase [Corynebacterium poyangense]QNQ90675.1 CoA-acylating methylmalonate-semialdehyde dehydrogenase [Corynebacterium poyangense]